MTTAVSAPRTAVEGSSAFWPVLLATVALAGASAIFAPTGWIPIALVIGVVALLGIPHGAMDHLVVEAIDRPDRGRFVRNYLLAMAGVGVLWLAAPPLALAIFLVLSVHHFGQSDLAYLGLPGGRQRLVEWSRGLFLVGVPLVAHVTEVSPVVERLGGGSPASWPGLADLWLLWTGVFVAQHVIVGVAATLGWVDRRVIGREALGVTALAALFVLADPLVGFAVYFGLWHSLSHLRVLTALLGTGPSPARSVARLAAPLTLVSLAGLAAVGGAAVLAGRTDLLVPVVFVFVSMLTLPHMVVVERLWATQRK